MKDASSSAAGRFLDLNHGNIGQACRGEITQTSGYEWCYADLNEPDLLEGEQWRDVVEDDVEEEVSNSTSTKAPPSFPAINVDLDDDILSDDASDFGGDDSDDSEDFGGGGKKKKAAAKPAAKKRPAPAPTGSLPASMAKAAKKRPAPAPKKAALKEKGRIRTDDEESEDDGRY